jgi:hypothetical protein
MSRLFWVSMRDGKFAKRDGPNDCYPQGQTTDIYDARLFSGKPPPAFLRLPWTVRWVDVTIRAHPRKPIGWDAPFAGQRGLDAARKRNKSEYLLKCRTESDSCSTCIHRKMFPNGICHDCFQSAHAYLHWKSKRKVTP